MNVAIDLDGTLAAWDADHTVCGAWLPGAREAIEELLAQGNNVVVHTCRATWEEGGGLKSVAEFLRSGGFAPCKVVTSGGRAIWFDLDERPEDGPHNRVGIWVGHGKPIAHWYIDDRAISFRGNWDMTLAQLALAEGERG